MMRTSCCVSVTTAMFLIAARVKPRSRLEMFTGIAVFPESSEKKLSKKKLELLRERRAEVLAP